MIVRNDAANTTTSAAATDAVSFAPRFSLRFAFVPDTTLNPYVL